MKKKVLITTFELLLALLTKDVLKPYKVVNNNIPADAKIDCVYSDVDGNVYIVIESEEFEETPEETPLPRLESPVFKYTDESTAVVDAVEHDGITEEFEGDSNVLENKIRNAQIFHPSVKQGALSLITVMNPGTDVGSILVNEDNDGRTGMISWLISDKKDIQAEEGTGKG